MLRVRVTSRAIAGEHPRTWARAASFLSSSGVSVLNGIGEESLLIPHSVLEHFGNWVVLLHDE